MKHLKKGFIKQSVSIALSLFMIITCLSISMSSINALTSGDFTYSVNQDDTVTITDYSSTGSKACVIPEKIDGKTVTTIGDFAFNSKELTSVTIPNGVTTIGGSAFQKNQLTSVTIPSGVTTIGEYVFAINQLTSVNIPNSVTTIGKAAFHRNRLSSVNIPDGVTTIREAAFSMNQLTSVTIPSGVTSIEDAAFQVNRLTSVIIPNSVTTIGNFAFSFNQLTNVTIPSSVTTIGAGAFNGNELPDSQAIIYARNENGIDNTKIVSYGGLNKSVVIPNGVITIGDSAFASNKLSEVIVLDKTTTFGRSVFSNQDSSGLTILGYEGSTIQTYANDNGLTFEPFKELDNTMVTDIPTQYFEGSAVEPEVEIKDNGVVLTKGVDYTLAYKDNDAIGTGKVIITGIGDYKYAEPLEKAFVIEKKQNKTNNVNTGDQTQGGMWMMLLMISGMISLGYAVKKKKMINK